MPYTCGFDQFCPGLAYQAAPAAKAFPWAAASRSLFFVVMGVFLIVGLVRKHREKARLARLEQARPLAERLVDEARERHGGGIGVDAMASTIEFFLHGIALKQPGMSEGLAALQEGRFEAAEETLAALGNAMIARGKRRARRRAAVIFGNLGNIALLHDVGKATEAYAMAADLNPNDAAILLNLGILRRRAGDIDAAVASFQRMLAIGSKTRNRAIVADASTHLGDIFEGRGAFGDAEWMFRKALAANEALKRLPAVAHLHARLGTLLIQRGKVSEARAHMQKARDVFQKIGAPQQMEHLERLLSGQRSAVH
jgi:tetratricopeptide (TPR) repeat protein